MFSRPAITQESTTCVSNDTSPALRSHFHVLVVNPNVHIDATFEAACLAWKLTTTDRAGSAGGDMVSTSPMLPCFRTKGLESKSQWRFERSGRERSGDDGVGLTRVLLSDWPRPVFDTRLTQGLLSCITAQ